jgi:signal peptidase I
MDREEFTTDVSPCPPTEEQVIKEEVNEVLTEKEAEDKAEKSPMFFVYELLHDLVYLLAAITLVFVFCVRLVGVSGDSMNPTLVDTDYLALQSNVIMGELKYGDVIVARELTFEDGEPIVKRVIATEGQSVEIRFLEDESVGVFVDGILLDEPYILEDMRPYYFEQDEDGDPFRFSTTVSEDCIFVMGDNRNNSSDSRVASIGEIKLDQVLGKVLMVVFPGQDEEHPRDFGRIGGIS